MCSTIWGKIAFWLTIVGGLNWGLVGLGMLMDTNLNLVYMLFGSWPTVESIIYLVVGISAIYMIFGCKKD
ncbi:MAG: DUF378 domain-containing protein [Candidatus Pacebacteria bacterium]|nr:DUF378 domain-containing protein [Candidatus Paceibacterota bacterium]